MRCSLVDFIMDIAPCLVAGAFSMAASVIARPARERKWLSETEKKLDILRMLRDIPDQPLVDAARTALERDVAATILEHNGISISDGKMTVSRTGGLAITPWTVAVSFLTAAAVAYAMHPGKGVLHAASYAVAASSITLPALVAIEHVFSRFPKTPGNGAYATAAARRIGADAISMQYSMRLRLEESPEREHRRSSHGEHEGDYHPGDEERAKRS